MFSILAILGSVEAQPGRFGRFGRFGGVGFGTGGFNQAGVFNVLEAGVGETTATGAFPMGDVMVTDNSAFDSFYFPSEASFDTGLTFDDGLLGSTVEIDGDFGASLRAPDNYFGFAEDTEQWQFFDGTTPPAGPEGAWKQYVDSFDVQPGAPERGTTIVNRQLASLDRWFPAFLGSPFVRAQQRVFGLQRPRYTLFPETPWEPVVPIVPCPPGTPELVCNTVAKQISATIPKGLEYENEEYFQYAFNQNLVRQGYRGVGGVNRFAPIGGSIPVELGPAPIVPGPFEPMNCLIEVWMTIPFNPSHISANVIDREDELWVLYDIECFCTATGVPQTDKCRLMVEREEGEEDITREQAFGQEFPPTFEGGLYGPGPAGPVLCGSFDEFDDNVGCQTVIIQGVTSPPPVQLPGLQAPQPQFNGETGFLADPYKCEMIVEYAIKFDSPIPWENHYVEFDVYYTQKSFLACQCDQFSNPIITTCRQATGEKELPEGNLELEPNFGNFGFSNFPSNPYPVSGGGFGGFPGFPFFGGAGGEGGEGGEGAAGPVEGGEERFGLRRYPYTQMPRRREGTDGEEGEEGEELTGVEGMKYFLSQCVAEAEEATAMATDAAARASAERMNGNHEGAELAAKEAAYFNSLVTIALEKAKAVAEWVMDMRKEEQIESEIKSIASKNGGKTTRNKWKNNNRRRR